MKFRIVQLIHNVGELKYGEHGRATIEFIIQKKNFWGVWKEIFVTEVKPKRIAHKSYADAEAYMISEYMGHGICTKNGNTYEYQSYTYYV
jgi:hypothetical protein